MKRRVSVLRSRSLLIGMTVVVLIAVAGIVYSQVARGASNGPNLFVLSSGSEYSGHIDRSYRTFNGLVRKEVAAVKGETLDVTYGAAVNKGSLSIEVKDPTGHDVWRLNVPDDEEANGVESLAVEQTGTYLIVVTGLDTGGSFKLSWNSQQVTAQH